MRQFYIPITENDWAEFYLTQAKQSGHGLAGFEGLPYQRGNGLGSFFRGLFRLILPVAKTVGKAVGKQALTTGANIASDFVQGHNLKETAEKHARSGVSKLLDNASRHLTKQKGGALGKRPKSKNNELQQCKQQRNRTILDDD